eukprot:g38155.t1
MAETRRTDQRKKTSLRHDHARTNRKRSLVREHALLPRSNLAHRHNTRTQHDRLEPSQDPPGAAACVGPPRGDLRRLHFGPTDQEQSFAAGRAGAVAFGRLPVLSRLRRGLEGLLPEAWPLGPAQGLWYADSRWQGVYPHGHTDSPGVLGVRLGAPLQLHWHWYQRQALVGRRLRLSLDAGDLYLLSAKAAGFDWRRASALRELGAAGGHYVCLVCLNRWLTLTAVLRHVSADTVSVCAQACLAFHVQCGTRLARHGGHLDECPCPRPAAAGSARTVCLACAHETSNCLQNAHLNQLESGFEVRVQCVIDSWPCEPREVADLLLAGLQSKRGSTQAAVVYWAAVHLVWGRRSWPELRDTGLARPLTTASSLGPRGLENAHVREDNWPLIQRALAMSFGGLPPGTRACAGAEVWSELLARRSQRSDRYQQEVLRLVTHRYLVQVKRARLLRAARGRAACAGPDS